MIEHSTPSDIERTSLGIITSELASMGIALPDENAAVIKRVIHASADFDYAETLRFTEHACQRIAETLAKGAVIVTDTNMARAGISAGAMKKLGCEAVCYMADPRAAQRAKAENTTRAAVSMRIAMEEHPNAVFAIGNAPTALFELCRLMEDGARPATVIAVPVGFVNVVEAKEEIFKTCAAFGIPCIAAMGRKGGSTIAAAVCNALLYTAADQLDPAKRGWN